MLSSWQTTNHLICIACSAASESGRRWFIGTLFSRSVVLGRMLHSVRLSTCQHEANAGGILSPGGTSGNVTLKTSSFVQQ